MALGRCKKHLIVNRGSEKRLAGKINPTLSLGALTAFSIALLSTTAMAAQFEVSNSNYGTPEQEGTMAWAIAQSNKTQGRDKIILNTNVDVGASVAGSHLVASDVFDLEGNGHTVDAHGENKLLTIALATAGGKINISNVKFQGGYAKGGKGGDGPNPGGGGMGAGGGLDNWNAALDLYNVDFANNQAKGGDAGNIAGQDVYPQGGGGGGGYNGGSGGKYVMDNHLPGLLPVINDPAGGGGSLFANGADGNVDTGNGGNGGGSTGGTGGSGDAAAQAGGFGGGGGGAGVASTLTSDQLNALSTRIEAELRKHVSRGRFGGMTGSIASLLAVKSNSASGGKGGYGGGGGGGGPYIGIDVSSEACQGSASGGDGGYGSGAGGAGVCYDLNNFVTSIEEYFTAHPEEKNKPMTTETANKIWQLFLEHPAHTGVSGEAGYGGGAAGQAGRGMFGTLNNGSDAGPVVIRGTHNVQAAGSGEQTDNHDVGSVGVSPSGITYAPGAGIEIVPGRLTSNPDVGDGGVTISGPGIVKLFADNSFRGNLKVIDGGTAGIDRDASLGSQEAKTVLDNGTIKAYKSFEVTHQLQLDSGNGTIDTNSNELTWSGLINGVGALNKDGEGKLTLTCSGNNYVGGTNILKGTLSVASDDCLGDPAGKVTINNDATLHLSGNGFVSGRDFALASNSADKKPSNIEVDKDGKAEIKGSVTGGSLSKIGEGLLLLSGANNSYDGNHVQAGTLQAGAAGAFGNGLLKVEQAASADLNNHDQNASGLEGSGNVTLGKANLTINVAAKDEQHNFAGSISGAGGLIKTGVGTQVLNGDKYSYSGKTMVNAGSFGIYGSAASSPFFVANGAKLFGSGTIGGLDSSGLVEIRTPESIYGNLSVMGDVVLRDGSVTHFNIAPDGSKDWLHSQGVLTIEQGAQAEVSAADGNYNQAEYVLATGDKGREGKFSKVIIPNTNKKYVASYDSNNFKLVADDGTGTDKVVKPDVTGETVDPVKSDVTGETVDPVKSGVAYGWFGMSVLNNAHLIRDAVSRRLRGDRLAAISGLAAEYSNMGIEKVGDDGELDSSGLKFMNEYGSEGGGAPIEEMPTSSDLPGIAVPQLNISKLSAWISPYGSKGKLDNQGVNPGFKTTNKGLTGGIDYSFTPEATIGAAFGYIDTDYSSQLVNFKGDVKSYGGLLYGRYQRNRIRLYGSIGYRWDNFKTSRTVTVDGVTYAPNGKFKAKGMFGSAEAAYLMPLQFATVEPFVGVDFATARIDSFKETGGGAGSLFVYKQNFKSIMSKVGVRLSNTMRFGESTTLTPELSVAWQHEFGDVAPGVRSTVMLSNEQLAATGIELKRDSVAFGARAVLGMGKSFDAYLGYEGVFGSKWRENIAVGGLRVKW